MPRVKIKKTFILRGNIMIKPPTITHPTGELSSTEKDYRIINEPISVNTFGGVVHVEWDPQEPVTPLGQLPFFIEFLKLSGLFEKWVDECPLEFTSNNAPSKRDVLGTLLLSILSGHKRYAHATTIRADQVNPQLLGMKKVVSEDSLRRALLALKEEESVTWLQNQLNYCYEQLLNEPWILDVDVTVKPLYGKQEGAVVGYNPKKPGRPSHTYHTYSMANLRLVLEAEVQAGNESASSYSAPDLWSLIDKLPFYQRPKFIRGDNAFGTDSIMSEAEERNLPYLFKLKMTKNVQKLIYTIQGNQDWTPVVNGFDAQESQLKLTGWEKARRVIILRQPIKTDETSLTPTTGEGQLRFDFGDKELFDRAYKYSVLVTSLPDDLLALTQHYRDRGDSENVFDELKNQWGWGGFTTKDLCRCRILARCVALIYNWWNIFVRLAEPDKHLEAVTSRPLLLHAIGKATSHGGQTFIQVTNIHGAKNKVQAMLNRLVSFFRELKSIAEQLTPKQRWYRMLSKAVENYLGGRLLAEPIPGLIAA